MAEIRTELDSNPNLDTCTFWFWNIKALKNVLFPFDLVFVCKLRLFNASNLASFFEKNHTHCYATKKSRKQTKNPYKKSFILYSISKKYVSLLVKSNDSNFFEQKNKLNLTTREKIQELDSTKKSIKNSEKSL